MRMIDADEVLARIENPYQRAEIARWLRDAPTIERKTGKWIKRALGWKCSNCNLCTNDRGADDFNFCPNCGADMRGEGHE